MISVVMVPSADNVRAKKKNERRYEKTRAEIHCHIHKTNNSSLRIKPCWPFLSWAVFEKKKIIIILFSLYLYRSWQLPALSYFNPIIRPVVFQSFFKTLASITVCVCQYLDTMTILNFLAIWWMFATSGTQHLLISSWAASLFFPHFDFYYLKKNADTYYFQTKFLAVAPSNLFHVHVNYSVPKSRISVPILQYTHLILHTHTHLILYLFSLSDTIRNLLKN